jgi:hypothetical protein
VLSNIPVCSPGWNRSLVHDNCVFDITSLFQQRRLSLSNFKSLNIVSDTKNWGLEAHRLGAVGVRTRPKNGKGDLR